MDPIVKRLKSRDPILNRLKKRRQTTPAPQSSSKDIIAQLKKRYSKFSEAVLDISQIHPDYSVCINDGSIHNPFIISPGLVQVIKKQTQSHTTKELKARAIYDWIECNIEYGKGEKNYSTSEEVIKQKRGICGEMTFVYVSMARSIGLDSSFVEVEKDYKNEKVAHACAMVKVERGDIQVDPAYHTYDIHHKKIKVLSDLEVLIKFNHWRDHTLLSVRKPIMTIGRMGIYGRVSED